MPFKKLKQNRLGFFIILITFFISANIAWLNPAPGKESYQPNSKIPLFWQYNYDSGIEILTAAYFPKIFYKDDTRIDRPTYPIIANLLGKIICLGICPIYKLSDLEKAGAGYILLKILIFSLALVLLNEIYKNYFNNLSKYLSNLLIFFSVISIANIATFHTVELQFITPIILTYLFINILTNYSLRKNLLFSIIAGIFMLGKPNYAIYLSILLFSFLNKHYFKTIFSFFFHFIPLIIYSIYLKTIELSFKFIGAQHDSGVWLIDYFYNFQFIDFAKKIILSIYLYLNLLWDGYSIWLILFFIGLFTLRNKINKQIYHFILILFLLNWFQIFFSDRYRTYMVSDVMFLVYPIASIYLISILHITKLKIRFFFIALLSFLIVSFNISKFVNLPLVHPYNQASKNVEKMNKKLNFIIK